MPDQTFNCNCECGEELVELPIKGLSFKVDKSALGTGGGIDPSLPSIDYSFEEQWTGKHWVDGKKIYQKTIECGAMPSNTTKRVPVNIDNIDTVVSIQGTASNGTICFTLPRPAGTIASVVTCLLSENFSTIQMHTGTNYTAYNKSFVTVQYTCTDR